MKGQTALDTQHEHRPARGPAHMKVLTRNNIAA